MDVADAARGANDTMLPGFSLVPENSAAYPCWYRGRASDGTAALVRRIEAIAFADAIRDLAVAAETLGTAPPGVAPSLAVAVTAGGRIVAGSAAESANFGLMPDAAAAGGMSADALVDVWVVYADVGDDVFVDAAKDPGPAAARLASSARALDALPVPHGAIDAGALRSSPDGPLVLAAGLAELESARRNRFVSVEPWLTVSPERCLPPGLPGRSDDQYALGVLWLVARTGVPPYRATTSEELVRSKLTAEPVIEGLHGVERDVIARALSTAADERFDSCTAFADALVVAVQAEHPRREPPVVEPTAQEPTAQEPTAPQPTAPEQSVPEQTTMEPSVVEPITAAPPVLEKPAARVDGVKTVPVESVERSVRRSAVDTPPDHALPKAMPAPHQPAGGTVEQAFDVRLAGAPYKEGDQILPGYMLVRVLGKGGFGEVWKATAPGGMSVAIKIIGNLARKEGSREFRALGTVKDLKHVHIVPIFGVWLKTSDGRLLDKSAADRAGEMILGQDGKHQFGDGPNRSIDSLELVVAMGLGDRSLYDVLKDRVDSLEDAGTGTPHGIEPAQLLEWMRQAARAIDYFNRGSIREGTTSEAVQHCDIKPQNILLVGNAVQVCDFGLARVQGQARATANNLLSIAYAAPEMMVRPFNPSPTTDQYCLAVTYYELRTGRLPYGGQAETNAEDLSVVELMKAKTEGKTDVSLVPATEQRVLHRALSHDPASRFGTCEEFIDMLEAAVDADTAAPATRTARFPWFGVASLTAGVMAAALMAWFLLSPDREREKPVTDFCLQARTTFAEALDHDGRVDLDKIARAGDLAAKAVSSGESCSGLREATEAVARVVPLIAAIDAAGADLGLVDRAKTAVSGLPGEVPVSIGDALQRAIVERVALVRHERTATVLAAIDAAVGDDGQIDAARLASVEKEAEGLGRLDEPEAKRLASVAVAVREISRVVGDPGHESAGLDAAVGRLDRAANDLPTRAAEVLGRGLARRLVDRAKQRLRDRELLEPGTPIAGKSRVIDDSCQDLSEALRLDPLSWAALDELGFCESLRGNHAEAIDPYGRALTLLEKAGNDPRGRDEVLRRRAYALVKLGRYAEAADDYLVCMRVQETLGPTLLRLAEDALQAGAFTESAAVCDRTLKLIDENPDVFGGRPPAVAEVLGSLVWLLVCGFGDDPTTRAVPLAKRQLALADQEVAAAAGNERREDAAAVARGNALDNLALAFARAGRWDDALGTIDEAIALVERVPRMQAEFRRHREAISGKKTWDQPM